MMTSSSRRPTAIWVMAASPFSRGVKSDRTARQPRIVGAATLADPAAVRIGQRVHVVPEKRTDDFAYFTVVLDENATS
jgi:hypothetical protein